MSDYDDASPHCGEVITDVDRVVLHEQGLDATRLDCPLQDLEAVVERERAADSGRLIVLGRW